MMSAKHATSLTLTLGALVGLTAPTNAQQHEDFDSYAPNTSVVGQGGWEEWSAGAGATVSNAHALSLGNSVDVNGPTDLVHQYSGYTSGRWVYSAKQYIPTGMTGSTYFIMMSSYVGSYVWAVQVQFDAATGLVKGDVGGAAGGATTPIVYDRWVDVKVVIDLDADWTQFYYNGVLLDDAAVPDHPTLGGGYTWTGGPGGGSNGPLDIAAVDLYANNASSVYYDEITLVRDTTWRDDFDSYAPGPVVPQGGWEEWSAGSGANVSNGFGFGPGNSIDVNGPTDLVHQYSGYTSGRWMYSAKQYIPSGLSTTSYFIMMSSYVGSYVWAVQVAFNPVSGNVEVDAGGAGAGATTPIVYDQWVDIQVVIDLTRDWVQFYYNGVLLDDANVANHPVLGGGYTWTGGPFGGSNGPLSIAAVDLYANNATSVYYDDISLSALKDGVRPFGAPTLGSNGPCRMYALDDALAGSSTFGFACRGGPASNSLGALAFSVANYPAGFSYAGINLLVNPSPFLLTAPAATDARGASIFPQPLAPTWAGWVLYTQYIWIDATPAGVLSASDALEISIH